VKLVGNKITKDEKIIKIGYYFHVFSNLLTVKGTFMKPISVILWSCVLCLQACAVSQSGDTGQFSKAQSLTELAGTYKNLAEKTKPQDKEAYLSAILWPEDSAINPADIDTIKVSVLNEDTVEVVAQSSSGSQLKAASFVRGKHFQLRNGQLEILSRSQVAGFQAGEPMVGVASEKIVIGLDSQGNGKVRQNMSATGMAFLIIPMHVSEETNLRFVKIP
jgi:hypothetical protein